MSKNSQSVSGSYSPYGDKAKSDWERQKKKKESTNLRDRGYPSSTNPSSQPKKKNQNPKATTITTYAEKTKADYYRGQEAVKNPNAKTVVDSSGNKYTPSEYKARQAYLKDRHESKSSSNRGTSNLSDRGYPSSTNPTSQPNTKASKTVESKERSTGSAYGDKTRSDWERGQKKSPKNTLEVKEKAKTRNTIEKVFKESTVKSAPPSKEEQEKMRRKGSRDAANMYSKIYSSRRG